MNIGQEIAALQRMTPQELRNRYAELFGETTNTGNKAFLIKRLAWRIQALAEGDLSERARLRAKELANDADLRQRAPKQPPAEPSGQRITASIRVSQDDRLPMPGAVISRQYKGQTHLVKVLPHGFEFEGEIYKSLSAVAGKITGSHCNGYLFFRLGQKGDES